MLKALVITLVTLISGLVLASQPLSATAIKAIEAQNQFLNDYNLNTTHGFVELKDLATLAIEAQNQFLNDYVTNSTHGFGATPSFPEAEAEVRYMKALLVNEDFVSCLNAIEILPLDSCLAANREHQFLNDYVTGQLK